MWKVLIFASLPGVGSFTVVVLLGGVGGLEAEVASLTVDSGSPLVCSMVVAMERVNMREAGASARRRDASRSAIVVRGDGGVWVLLCVACGRSGEGSEAWSSV